MIQERKKHTMAQETSTSLGPVFPVAQCTFLVRCCPPSSSPPFCSGPPGVLPVSYVAAVPVVPGARRACTVIILILVLVVLLPSLSSSLPFSSSCHPCRGHFLCCSCSPPGVRPGPGLPCSLFPHVFVVSCCPCCPAALLSFRVVLIAVSSPSGRL